MSEFELHLPANFRLQDTDGNPISLAQLTDDDCAELASEFLLLLIERRDMARLH